ncbi:MAG TPA: aminotransferase class I/II-fold pyridoxal phosphate-dependent enzyme, partial [Longimicrobiales bacterium]|nr:aminotransferase class I/II-fold pyridoxal phosphate-dependent enzyme [Longimicrobiales bacterium]
RTRRDLVVSLMGELMPDASYVRPEGAFYLFFRVDDHYDDEHAGSIALCQHLIQEAGVALVPGAAFGDDRYVRLSFAASDQDLENGLRRVAGLLLS